MSHRTHKGGLAEQHTERVFRDPAILALIAFGAVCLLAVIAGCAETGDTVSPVGIVAPSRNFATTHSWRYGCERTYDPVTGLTTEKVTVEDLSQPDQNTVNRLAEVAEAGIAKIPGVPPGVPMAARPEARAAPLPPLSAEACLGTHFQGDAGTPPNPIPPSWGQAQQDDPVDHGSQPELMRVPERQP
jgi:hypothetical protein